MKNKHLVLIFLLVLTLGLLSRFIPWPFAAEKCIPLKNIAHLPRSIVIEKLPEGDLSLIATDGAWIATQGDRSVPVSNSLPDSIRSVLQQICMNERVSEKPEPAQGLDLQVNLQYADNILLELLIGKVFQEYGKTYTYISGAELNGVYLAPGNLRVLLERRLEEFRNTEVLGNMPQNLSSAAITYNIIDTIYRLMPPDSLKNQADTLFFSVWDARWISALQSLKKLPFADFFDDSRTRGWTAQISCTANTTSEPVVLSFYKFTPHDRPESWSSKPEHKQLLLSPWVLHSSLNPGNYFAIQDTALIRQLFLKAPSHL
ncbi:MAG: DUF4340 domain-containing protein [Chitinophagales bacterium]|nr:DUF4340 domain-containing protein [Chitinophagales bacterium]